MTAAGTHDYVFEALCEIERIDWNKATSSELGRVNRITKELKAIGAEPEEILARAAEHRRIWPQLTCSAQSVCRNWSKLKPKPRDPGYGIPIPFERPDAMIS